MNLLSLDVDVDALVTDHYLESLFLAGGPVVDGEAAGGPPDPAIRVTANRLSRDLVRVHPSFRFEERLAARLAEASGRSSVAMAATATAPAPGSHLALESPTRISPAAVPATAATSPAAAATSPAATHGSTVPTATLAGAVARPLLIGGALTSAALAGAAYVAWRRGRVPSAPRLG